MKLFTFGHGTIDLRELAYVGPAGCLSECVVSITVTLKSGAERTLHANLPPGDLPVRPKPGDFPASMFASKADMAEDISRAKARYAKELAALADIARADLIAA